MNFLIGVIICHVVLLIKMKELSQQQLPPNQPINLTIQELATHDT